MAHPNPTLAIQTHFADLDDPRIDRTRLHNLMDIVAIALCAVICGSEGWQDIAKYGVAKHAWLKTFLTLPNGFPPTTRFAASSAYWTPRHFRRASSAGSMP